jgi:glycosyltransferase involved in cell wall biosynthesis
MLNDEEVAEFSSRYLSDFFNWINSQNSGSEDLMIVSLHSLLGHSAIDLHDALKGRSDYIGNFYIHDYYSFCTSVKLMRNDWQFCGAPPVSSMSCKFCIHGSGRLHHSDQIRLVIELEQIQLLSPSHFVKELWLEKYGQEKEIIVFPHSELNNRQLLERSYSNNSPIRIAFVGYPVKAKGWFEFLELVKMNLNEKVSFHVISVEDPQIDDVNFVYVAQTSKDVNLTTNALLSSEIDLVFVWPNWPETYSYVTMEALAAGCQIVTNTNSGNVRFLAEQFSASFVYETTDDFQKDLNSGTIRKKLENRDLYKYEHEHGSYLLSILLEKD